MTKQEILDTLRQWRDKAKVELDAADAAAEVAGQTRDFGPLKIAADRIYYRWKYLSDAIDALVDVDEEQP